MPKQFLEGKWRQVLADGQVGPPCDPPTDEERREIENEQQRAKYQEQANRTREEVWWRGEKFVPQGPEPAPRKPKAGPRHGTKLYKVITQRDEFFKSKFNPEALEELINVYAEEGWRVVSMAASDVGSFWGSFWGKGGGASRQELIVLLEKTVEGEASSGA